MFDLQIKKPKKPKQNRGVTVMLTFEENEAFEKRLKQFRLSKAAVIREFIHAFSDGKIGVSLKD